MTDQSSSTASAVAAAVAGWEATGERVAAGDHQVWCTRVPAVVAGAGNPPLVVLHGFPTCSFDWVPVLPALSAQRDVVLLDFLGFGLSDKPDLRYGLRAYADGVEAVAAHFGLDHVDLLTHDLGDSVGGEILARSLEGSLGFSIGRRVVTNGSIYMDLAHLTMGQEFLLGLPDEQNELVGADGGASFRNGVVATFAAASVFDEHEVDCVVALAARSGGLGLLPRTIRYVEDRRAEERRFTGAIETHPTPVGVVWGDQDPVAVYAMAQRFVTVRTDAPLVTLEGVGHYPMIEAPDRFAAAVLSLLEQP